MKYKLTVIKYEEDKGYEEKLAKWKEDTDWQGHQRYNEVKPERELCTRSLEVFLSDEEYEKVKQEVIKIFK
jgi:hypothetical protein